MLKIPESKLVMQVIHYLHIKGYACGKTKTLGVVRQGKYCYDKYAFRGFPDLTAFCPFLVFIECKTEKGRQTKDQQSFQELCQRVGTPYILARSLDDVIEVVG